MKGAWQEYHSNPYTKRNSRQRRIRKQAEGLYDLDPSKTIDQYQEQIGKLENMKRSHRKIKTARGKMKGNGVYMLEKTVGTEKIMITNKDQIEVEALSECWNKVHAADRTTTINRHRSPNTGDESFGEYMKAMLLKSDQDAQLLMQHMQMQHMQMMNMHFVRMSSDKKQKKQKLENVTMDIENLDTNQLDSDSE